MTSFSDWVASIPFFNSAPPATQSPLLVTQSPIPATSAAPAIPKLADAIKAVAPNVDAQRWADTLFPFMVSSGITTPKRIAAFLGQVAEESARFSVLTENLNYSAVALRNSWPSHFDNDDANDYARQPERIANRAYADRMGNGDEVSGDGWRYRGAGLIQLTGKDNQSKFAAACGVSGDVGDYLRTGKGAAQSACWYWSTNNLSALADGWQITELTKRVNGGTNGLTDRINMSNAALKALG